MGAYLPSEFPIMDSGDCFLPLREGVMFPDGCTLPAGVVLNIPVLPVKTTQTGVQHHGEGSANCISVGFMVRSPPTYWRVQYRYSQVLRHVCEGLRQTPITT